MRYGALPGIDKPLSRLVQGSLMLARASSDDANQLLDAVYDAGCRAFDTAPVYGRGLAERRLGAWLGARRLHDVIVIDKGGHPKHGQPRVTPEHLGEDLGRSLDCLGIERIDLYLLHRDQPDVPVGELVDCLNGYVEAGRITRFGASNWSHERIERANRYAAEHEKLGFVASSPEFSLVVPVTSWSGCLSIAGSQGGAARAWYAQSGLPVLAWSPLASGFLTGAYLPGSVASSDREQRVLEFYGSPENFERLGRLGELSRTRRVSPSSVALAYVLCSKMDAYPTLGCESGTEFSECLRALDLGLSPEEVRWLESGNAG